ncbi:MAG: DUF4013 domain-containing protein [Methanobrevibacter sp.]|jgi:hypothetical protein|nr:DUF4013 domain-containing protein [Methanobrevibacter sp.]
MSFSEIFSDGLKYPLKDLKSFFILGILFFIPEIISFFENSQFSFLLIMLGIIFIVVHIFASGYAFSITKNTIEKNEDVPIFQIVTNLVNGIKVFVAGVIYFIILSIISLILLIVALFTIPSLNNLVEKLPSILNQTTINPANINDLANQILSTISSSDLLIIACLALILFVIFIIISFATIIGVGRFAETGNLSAFFGFKEIFKRISAIGKLKFLGLGIVTYIICFIMGAIFSIIGLIPIGPIRIGVIIVIIESPYLLFFTSRIFGLIYNEGEIEDDKDLNHDIVE